MIFDTTFLSDLLSERFRNKRGPASELLFRVRGQKLVTTVISIGEVAVLFDDFNEARHLLSSYRQLRLTPEIAYAAALVDREMIKAGSRLGENDNWIAGFCRYYGQAVISRDRAFDRVRGLRRMSY